jgi:hypothetical protein
VGDLEVRASFGLSYYGRPEAEQRAFRMLGLLPADFPAWNLAARAFARECLAEAEPPGVGEESLARLADQYIGAARLASALVHPGTPDPEAAPASQLLAEAVVRGDPWGWFMTGRASLVRLAEQAHAARL